MPPTESLENDSEPGKSDAPGKPWKVPSPEELDLNTAGTTTEPQSSPRVPEGHHTMGTRGTPNHWGHCATGDTTPWGTHSQGGAGTLLLIAPKGVAQCSGPHTTPLPLGTSRFSMAPSPCSRDVVATPELPVSQHPLLLSAHPSPRSPHLSSRSRPRNVPAPSPPPVAPGATSVSSGTGAVRSWGGPCRRRG